MLNVHVWAEPHLAVDGGALGHPGRHGRTLLSRHWHGLHGDQLDFVGDTASAVSRARHAVHMLKDGG